MKKYFYIVLLVVFSLILQGWNIFKVFNKHEGPENGFVWYLIKENGLYGAVDEKDNILLPCHFQSISLVNDWKNGNDYTDYLWQLKWEVIDEHGDCLDIRMYTFDDEWRYYTTYNKRTEKTKVSNRYYDNVVIPYEKQSVSTLFRNKKGYITEDAPSITKLHLFYVSISQYGCGIYKENGEAIIPVERRVGPIVACEGAYRVWYMYNGVVCDAKGTEIFRTSYGDYVLPVEIKNQRQFMDLYDEITEQYKWYGVGFKYLIYDADKGFGSLQAKYDDEDYIIGYYIKFTGIKLGKNSTSFDIEPSGDNEPGKLIDLRTYRAR